MPWLVKLDKDDFVGKWALEHFAERGPRERLVGFEMENGVVPAEGAQIVIDGRRRGGSRARAGARQLGRTIGLAWVPPELAEDGTRFEIRVDRACSSGRASRRQPFFDPDGERLRS